jgi:hypothetical protein
LPVFEKSNRVIFFQIGVKASDNHNPTHPNEPTMEATTSIELRTTRNIQPVFTETSSTMYFTGNIFHTFFQYFLFLNQGVAKPRILEILKNMFKI